MSRWTGWLQPSRWEGCGQMLVEAMTVSIPIVAADVGTIRDVTGRAARIVSAENPVSIAGAVADFDPQARDRAARTELARARSFGWTWVASSLAAADDCLPWVRSP
jgi:glycosyltransferase involved in cell wall biosynthesis